MRRTKIVATLGPATNTPERIAQLITAGLNVARLNLSHGTHEEHAALIAMVRAAAQRADQPVGILLDLQGPKIRTGSLVEGNPVELVASQQFTITTRDTAGTEQCVSTTYDMLPVDVRIGSCILISDGLIELRVLKTSGTEVETEVVHGGELREHQGINLPGVAVTAPTVTKKDVDDLFFGLSHNVNYIALSFVRSANDVQRVKDLITQAGKETPVIAKIERPEAVENLMEILQVADGVMVARGDLGVEMPIAQVPIVQKRIIEAANASGIPVITATQMLESMISNPRPTRAEVSDVANAIIDGTDAVMLSGETAKGLYPVEAVEMMAMVAEQAEQSKRHGDQGTHRPDIPPRLPSASRAIGAAAQAIVHNFPIAAIVVFTQSGTTARLVSQQRPGVPILAFTHSEQVYGQLALLWGITPLRADFVDSLALLEQQIQTVLVQRGYVHPGDYVVMAGGHPIAQRGQTNFLKIVEIT